MKIDAELLERKEPAFRLYGWSPMCVSVGRNQKDDFLKNDSRFTLHGSRIDIVRRLTGGRALLHDNEITYSVVCPAGKESVTESYKRISQVLVDAFARLGIELEFGGRPKNAKQNNCMLVSTGADLCYRGKKLIGSAQFRKDGWILQHGSILYDYSPVLLEEIFGEPVGGEITCIKEIAQGLSKQEIIEMLQTCNMF
jgi:lipoate-protein ligase A